MEGSDLNIIPNANFPSLTDRLLRLTNTKQIDKKLINSCLVELNDLHCKNFDVKNPDAVLLLVNQLIGIVQPGETCLVRSTCQFIANVIKAKVSFYGRTRAACKRWILEVLEFSEPLAWNSILMVLQNLIHLEEFNTNQDLQFLLGNKGLLNKTLKLGGGKCSEWNLQAMECLYLVLTSHWNAGMPIPFEHVLKIKSIALETTSLIMCSSTKDPYQDKLLSMCLRILRAIINGRLIALDVEFTGEIFGIVQVLMFHGIKGYATMKAEALRPAAMNLPERTHVVPKARHTKTPKVKARKSGTKSNSVEINSISTDSKGNSRYFSDSDTSDTDTYNAVRSEENVRLETARLFQSVIEKTPPRETFGFWPQIVSNDSRNDARVLARSILKEPSSKVRQVLLSTLTELLVNARLFLVHAEDVKHSSFMTFFGTVSLMLKELHRSLSLCINAEKNAAVLMHALKCVAALVQGTPYARLKPGLVTKIIRTSRSYLQHKDPTVKVAALSVFESLASSEPMTQEILSLLSRQDITSLDSEEPCLMSTSDVGPEEEEVPMEDLKQTQLDVVCTSVQTDLKNMSALLSVCLRNISSDAVSTPVRLQTLKVLGKLALNAKCLTLPYLERIATVLIGVIEEPETQVVLHACRVLETISGTILNEDTNVSVFWNIIFDPMINLFQHPQTTLRAVACDCLGSIGSNMLTQLPRPKVILIITVLFGAVRDKESAVRAAGLRALGMLVALPSLEEDTGFLLDLAEYVCTALDDQNLGVRVKAVWALANLCDCLIRRKNDEDVEPLPLNTLLPKLYEVGLRAVKDNDKVKCNAVRAVGSVLYLCPNRLILIDTSTGLEALINCAKLGNDMKVRWNACHALGLVLSHTPDDILPSSWREQVFPTLSTLICHSPNFKVRANAAWALSTCNSYGKYMPLLWRSIILAFENAQHVPSYVEYSHRDALVQQLCLTLGHVAVHTKTSDLQSIWTEICDYTKDISIYLKQFRETVLPEKTNNLIKAKGKFEKCAQNASSMEEKRIAKCFAHIFERDNHYDNLLQQ